MFQARARGGRARARYRTWLCYCGITHTGITPSCGLCDYEVACPTLRAIDLGEAAPAELKLCIRCDSLPPAVQRAKHFSRRIAAGTV